MVQPRPLFVYFHCFQIQFSRKIVDFSGIRTQIVGVKGEQADHLTTTTTAQHENYLHGEHGGDPEADPGGWGPPVQPERDPRNDDDQTEEEKVV